MTKFWETKTLEQMSDSEWESLCDGCGWCCVHMLEDDHGNLYQTEVACDLIDPCEGHCTRYADRFDLVPECNKVSLDLPEAFPTMPETCAYRRLYYGQSIPQWHPLITGSKEAMHQGGHSVRGRIIVESEAGDLEDHVLAWTPIKMLD